MDATTSQYITVQAKVRMLDNLLDIEVAYSLLRGGSQDDENDPIDINYEKLKTKIEVRSTRRCNDVMRLCVERRQLVINLLFHRLLTIHQKRLISLSSM